MVCLAAIVTLAFLTFLEYDNSSPWHELQHPRLLKGLRVGPTLVEGASMLVVYCAISGLPPWDRLPALALLVAPLAYPTVMQGFHRFQVRAKICHSIPVLGVRNLSSYCVCVFCVCFVGSREGGKTDLKFVGGYRLHRFFFRSSPSGITQHDDSVSFWQRPLPQH